MNTIFKYGRVENGKFDNPFLNQQITEFLKASEGKLVAFEFREIGEDLPEWRRFAYFHAYIVPAFVELMNEEKTRFPEVPKETKATVKDFLKRMFIGEDNEGNPLSTKIIANERWLSDLINPIIAFAKLMYNTDLEPPRKDWRIKQFILKQKTVQLCEQQQQ